MFVLDMIVLVSALLSRGGCAPCRGGGGKDGLCAWAAARREGGGAAGGHATTTRASKRRDYCPHRPHLVPKPGRIYNMLTCVDNLLLVGGVEGAVPGSAVGSSLPFWDPLVSKAVGLLHLVALSDWLKHSTCSTILPSDCRRMRHHMAPASNHVVPRTAVVSVRSLQCGRPCNRTFACRERLSERNANAAST